jgi:hypothetical protein
MARAKWNPKTGRFETSSGVDNPPNGFAPAGTQYVDAVTGQTKIAGGGGAPDVVIGNAGPTTTGAPKAKTAGVPKPKTNAKGGSTTSTTVPKAGAKPAGSAPSRGGQGGVAPTAQQIQALRTGPTPTSAVNQALEEPTDSNDALLAFLKSQAAIAGSGGTKTPTAAELAAKYQAGVAAGNIQEQAGVNAQTQYNTLGQSAYDNAVNAFTPMFAGQTADVNKFYDAQTGTANTNYDNQLAAMQKYYAQQGAQAGKTIGDAGATFLAGLPDATAFANAQVANLPQAQQQLGDALAAYGATGNEAKGVSTQDAAFMDAIAKMQTSANTQLSSADKAYMASLRTAGMGANTAAQQALAGNIAGLQAQDTSGINTSRRNEMSDISSARRGELGNIKQSQLGATSDAESLRQSYISKGIDALMSGKQTAAETKAQAAADYGVPKKEPAAAPAAAAKAPVQVIKKAENLAKAPKNPTKGQVWKNGPQGKNWAWDGKNWTAKTSTK